jgi:tetratricopeptide (TPR) repeat protein
LSTFVLAVVVTACATGTRDVVERAAAASAAERWTEAYEAWGQAVDRAPANLDRRRERVRAALQSGALPELEVALAARAGAGSPAADRYELALAVAAAGEPGSDARAIELLEGVATDLPQIADVHLRLGLLRLEQEEWVLAAAALERAVDLAPREARYRVALAAALVEIGGREGEVREVLAPLPELRASEADVARGQAILARLTDPLRRVPEALREAYREAIAALSEEAASTGEAVQLIEEATRAAPASAPFVVLDGLASVRLGQLGRARAAFLRATELEPGDPVPWLELAGLAEAAEDLAAAERYLQQAIAADPLGPDAWSDLGRVRYQRRRFVEAAAAFERLAALDGGALATRLWHGRALRRAGRDDAAEALYLETLQRYPRNYEVCLQLGHIYRRRRLAETDRARSAQLVSSASRYYRLALDVRPSDPLVQRLLESLEGGRDD